MRTGAGEVKARSGPSLSRGVGHWRLAASHTVHAALGLCSVSATEPAFSSSVNPDTSLTASFHVDLSAKLWL